MKDDVLYRKFSRKDGTATYHQFVVPKSLRSEILQQMHNNVCQDTLVGRRHLRRHFSIPTGVDSEKTLIFGRLNVTIARL